jgi:hypothetical protein
MMLRPSSTGRKNPPATIPIILTKKGRLSRKALPGKLEQRVYSIGPTKVILLGVKDTGKRIDRSLLS